MDHTSMLFLVRLIAEGVGVTKDLVELAQRIKNGEQISKAEVEKARKEINSAKTDWKKTIAKKRGKKPTLVTNPEQPEVRVD
jgi:hypothetical protein